MGRSVRYFNYVYTFGRFHTVLSMIKGLAPSIHILQVYSNWGTEACRHPRVNEAQSLVTDVQAPALF